MKRVLRMFAVSAVASAALATAGWAQNPQAFLSWGTACPTIVTNTDFSVAGSYTMYVGLKNLTAADANVGTDCQIFYGPNVPDAWRFDDAGCQTGSQIHLNNSAVNKSCPLMKGTNSLTITNVGYDPGSPPRNLNRMNLRLSITYDPFTPAPGTNYTLWTVVFDHSFSSVGPTPPGNATCGGVDQPLCISFSNTADQTVTPSFLLTTSNTNEYFQFAQASDQYITWNGGGVGCPGSVPTLPATWGKLKGLYH